MHTRFITFLGWYGMIAILVAFAGVSFQLIQPTSLTYQLLNLTGALGLFIETLSKKDYPASGLNIVFAGIALVALLKLFFS